MLLIDFERGRSSRRPIHPICISPRNVLSKYWCGSHWTWKKKPETIECLRCIMLDNLYTQLIRGDRYNWSFRSVWTPRKHSDVDQFLPMELHRHICILFHRNSLSNQGYLWLPSAELRDEISRLALFDRDQQIAKCEDCNRFWHRILFPEHRSSGLVAIHFQN